MSDKARDVRKKEAGHPVLSSTSAFTEANSAGVYGPLQVLPQTGLEPLSSTYAETDTRARDPKSDHSESKWRQRGPTAEPADTSPSYNPGHLCGTESDSPEFSPQGGASSAAEDLAP